MKRIGLLLVLATTLSIACNNRNAATTTTATTETGAAATGGVADTVKSADKDFVHDVAIANLAEVQLGRLAVEHSKNAQVKKFAQMMIDDHTKAGDSLSSVASRYNIAVPSQIDDKHRDLSDKLSTLQGAEFDREYMSAMVDGHDDVLDKVGSRVDQSKLADWKTRMAESLKLKKETPAEAEVVVPEKSDDPVTMSVNQWAADAYPVVYKHLESAKSLNDSLKRGRTTQ